MFFFLNIFKNYKIKLKEVRGNELLVQGKKEGNRAHGGIGEGSGRRSA